MIAVKAALVLSIACAAATAMRRQSAAWRHAVLALGFAVACALPLLEQLAPGWGSSVAPSVPGFSATAPSDHRIARIVWFAGAGLGLLSIAIGLARLLWIRHGASVVDARCQAIADEAVNDVGLRRTVVVLETDRPMMPITWGLLRPKILLPTLARDWTDDCLRAVFRHELAHVRRADWAVHLAATVMTRVFWFNPLAWLAAQQLRLESERACDDAVINLGIDGADYAAHLIQVARAMKNRSASPGVAPAAARRRGFERRIAATLDPQIDRTPLSLCGCVMTAVMFVATVVPIAGFGQPATSAPSLLGVQRDVLRRFGGEERRFSIVAEDVSFRKNNIRGRVELQARLNVDGSVSSVRILEPVHPDLATAAEVIVRHWRREPARVRGVPVEVPIRMTVDFRR